MKLVFLLLTLFFVSCKAKGKSDFIYAKNQSITIELIINEYFLEKNHLPNDVHDTEFVSFMQKSINGDANKLLEGWDLVFSEKANNIILNKNVNGSVYSFPIKIFNIKPESHKSEVAPFGSDYTD